MTIFERVIEFSTTKELEIVDITDYVEEAVEDSGIKDGICLVFVPGATGAVILNENDSSLLEDLKNILNENDSSLLEDLKNILNDLIPQEKEYEHPINARSHLRAILLGNNQCISIKNGKLELGTWQQIMFINLDTRARKRKVIIKIIGD